MSKVKTTEFFVSGGTLPPNSRSYIERRADSELLESLVARRYCCVLNSRQMGKSSLSVRTMMQLAEQNVQSVFIDLPQIGGRNIQPSQWYRGLVASIGDALGLADELFDFEKANADLSPMQRFFKAIGDVVLPQTSEPIVIFIDEIDATRNFPFDTDEFFAGIRECYNRRVHDDAFRRLTFCLLGVAVPSDLIRNPVTTPFNIGDRIRLEDFNLDEVRSFGPALGAHGGELAKRVHYWTNGQPFLTQALCQALVDQSVEKPGGVDQLVERLFFDPKALATNPNLADVANRALNDPGPDGKIDRFRADLLSAYESALKGGSVTDDEGNRVAVVLNLSGLMRAESARLLVRNRIYRHVFNRS